MLVAEIIGVGAALAERGVMETNARMAARELEACGISVSGRCAVGTNSSQLRGAIAQALGRSDVVILMGGLGAGADGITKEIVCEGLGRRLVLHEESLRRIREAYERAGRQMPQQVSKLAMLPEQSIVFPGSRGITPGCALSAGKQFIIMIPEKSEEFLPMFRQSIVPYLAKFSEAAVVTHMVNSFGLDQKAAEAALGDLLKSKNPTVAVYPKQGEMHVRVNATAGSKPQAEALCQPVIKKIQEKLGEHAYGVDEGSLTSLVFDQLYERRVSVSAAESSTGGLLAEMLTGVSGNSPVLRFSVSAGTDRLKLDALRVPEKILKKFGGVSAQVAAAMAYGAMMKGNSALGVAVTGSTGARGEDAKKTGQVYVAVCDNDDVWVRSLTLPKTTKPDYIRYMACMTALDLIRMCIRALPKKYAGGNPLKTALTGKISNISEAGGAVKGAKRKRPWYAAIFPVKGDDVRDVIRKLILIIAVAVFAGSAWYLISFYGNSASNKDMYNTIENAYGGSELSDKEIDDLVEQGGYPKGFQKKFASLYQINEDVAGWLNIPDSQINYPVVHYKDNDYYLRRDFKRQKSKYGVPWLEAKDSMDPQSSNYIIYGHNMTDGQMFGELMQFKPSGGGLAYMQKHPTMSFDDVYRDNTYKIVSVFITNVKEQYGPIFYYNDYLDLTDETKYNEFISEITARSYYTSNIDVKYGDQFLTLSTCSYEYGPVSDDAHVRTVIVGRRVRDGEKADGSDVTYALNPAPKMPTGFTKDNSNAAIKAAAAASATQSSASQAASAAASSSAAASNSTAASSSSKPVSSSENENTDLAYELEQVVSRAQSAKTSAERARDSARSHASDAENSGKASDARASANRAADAASSARSAYEKTLDALDYAQQLYDEYGTAEAKNAYRTVSKAVDAAQTAYDDAASYADSANAWANYLEKEQNSSSSVPSSSSHPSSSSTPSSSSSTPPPSSSAPSSSAPPPSSSSTPSSTPPPSSSSEPSSTPPPSSNDETAPPPANESSSSQPSANATINSSSAPENTESTSVVQTEGDYVVEEMAKKNEKLSITTNGKKLTGSVTDIVSRVVMNEMGPGFSSEAIKAQAVAAYTFIKYSNQSGSAPYLGTKTPTEEIYDLTAEVTGRGIYYKNKLAFTPFHATSAGVTNASADVWGGSYPYLVSVDSEIDEDARNYRMTTSFDEDVFADRVDAKLGIDLYDYSDDPRDWVEILSYTEGDKYVKEVRVGDDTVSGRALRESVLGLRSAAFDVKYKSGQFTFITYGYGHGVGMSQTGANLYAENEGWDYVDILTHYYPGCKVK